MIVKREEEASFGRGCGRQNEDWASVGELGELGCGGQGGSST